MTRWHGGIEYDRLEWYKSPNGWVFARYVGLLLTLHYIAFWQGGPA